MKLKITFNEKQIKEACMKAISEKFHSNEWELADHEFDIDAYTEDGITFEVELNLKDDAS